MSYRSSINQRNLLQTLFQNTSIVSDSTNPNAPATVSYVNSEVDPLITEVQDLQQLTTSLQKKKMAERRAKEKEQKLANGVDIKIGRPKKKQGFTEKELKTMVDFLSQRVRELEESQTKVVPFWN